MTTFTIKYRELYPSIYQLLSGWHGYVPIYPKKGFRGFFYSLSAAGLLIVKPGFVWDGPSGRLFGIIDLTPNEPATMIPSLIHDALARAMARGELPYSWLPASNELFEKMLIDNGFDPGRAGLWRSVLDFFWRPDRTTHQVPPTLTAPTIH